MKQPWQLCRTLAALAAMITQLLVAGRSSADIRVFHAEAVKNSTMTYESIFIRFSLRNDGARLISYRPFVVARNFVDVVIRDLASGLELRLAESEYYYVPDRNETKVATLQPGVEHVSYSDLIWTSALTVDTSARIPYFPPGRYRAVFRYTYDPYGRLLEHATTFLLDSADFVVEDPSGDDSVALASFLGARRNVFHESRDIGMNSLWEMSLAHPQSPYAGQALEGQLRLLHEGAQLPDGVEAFDVVKALVLSHPGRPDCRRWLNSAPSGIDQRRWQSFLRLVRDSVPGTLAGAKALDLLKTGQGK